ncbi:putative protein YbgK [compost metagenome]
MIEILSNGALNSVQDLGRTGCLNIGVSNGGAMDVPALTIGNLLLGNPPDFAGLEVVLFPFRIKILADCRLALTGADCSADLDERIVAPGWVVNARAGQILTLRPPRRGARCYITFAGGIDVEPVMGSRSTDLKTGFGGFKGRALQKGDVIPVGGATVSHRAEFGSAMAVSYAERGGLVNVRVLPGAEFDAFDEPSRSSFFSQEWTITQDSNRTGMRLKGEPLSLSQPLEMLSHGILPGTIQVPPAGQPMIQLADANTSGGYPKIGHVIDADLALLAQAPIGSRVRFNAATQQQALAAQEELDRQLNQLQNAVQLKYRYA